VQENEEKIILRLVGRGKMLQCPLGKEVMLLRQSGEREGHYTVFERGGGEGEGRIFCGGDEDRGDF